MKTEETVTLERVDDKDYRMLITYKDNKPDKYHVVEMVKVASFDSREDCRKALIELKYKK